VKTSILSKALWKLQNFGAKGNQSGLLDFATIICCEIKEDESIEQIATNGSAIHINPKWWAKQPVDNQVFALSHEAGHIQNAHVERGAKVSDPTRWNLACDIWVNHVRLKNGHRPTRDIYIDGNQFGITNPERYTVEQIYKKLPATKPEDRSKSGQQGKAGPGKGNDMMPSPQSGTDKIDVATRLERIKQVAKGMNYNLAYLPAEMEDTYKEMTAPSKNWAEECAKFVARMRESHWSTSKLMASYRARRVIMPAIKRYNKLEFGFVLDTSGSIEGPTYSAFVSTVKDAFSQLKPERMIAVLADDMVRKELEFDKLPDRIPFVGRGGTDFRPALKYFEEKYPEIGGVIYLTDGYGEFPRDPPKFPLLWAIDNPHVKPPFGDVCRI
jgi:predicted metal-dependent peptidase